jgi:hypothetical protein
MVVLVGSRMLAFIGEETLAIAWLESAFARGFMNYRYLSGRSPVFRKLGLKPCVP